MSVDSFDPSALQVGLTPDALAQFLAAAGQLESEQFGLDDLSIKRLGPLARTVAADWAKAAEGLEDGALEALVRFFTLAEARLQGWESGAKSPVIPLMRALKSRGYESDALTAWIKANTDNRFLPHGSLMDRL